MTMCHFTILDLNDYMERSFQLLLNLPVQNFLEAMLSVEDVDEPLHIFVGLCDSIGYTSFVDKCPVLLLWAFGFCGFEVSFVEVNSLVIAAFLFVEFSEVVGTISLGVLNLQLLGELVVVVQVVFCKLNLLHLQVALSQ